MRTSLLILAFTLMGCASAARWADNGLVAGPPEYVGITTGVAINTLLLVAKRPWWQRLLTVETVAYAKRFTTWFGPKWEGWHLEVNVGAFAAEWGSWFVCRGPCN